MDLAKAFDTISHDLFAKGLERLGVPSQFIRVVERPVRRGHYVLRNSEW